MVVTINKCVMHRFGFTLADLAIDGIDKSYAGPLRSSDDNTCLGSLDYSVGTDYQFVLVGGSDCGTVKTSNDTHVSYENAISGSAGSDRGVALRTIDMFTHFQCSFTTLVQISLAIGNVGVQHVKMELNSVLGEFDVKMALFSDESFTTQVAGQHVVNVPDSVYVGINVEDLNARYKLTMVNCFMTPDKEFNNVVKYNVITDRCVHSTVYKIKY